MLSDCLLRDTKHPGMRVAPLGARWMVDSLLDQFFSLLVREEQMNRKGFTLIELLIVVVIIGILAAIAIPKFANTKEKAYITSMKADLRNLVTAEEAYFADSVKYTTAYGAGGVNFVQSTGNTTPAVTTTADGWTANITNVNTTKTCSIYIGSTALLPANKEGEPKCQ